MIVVEWAKQGTKTKSQDKPSSFLITMHSYIHHIRTTFAAMGLTVAPLPPHFASERFIHSSRQGPHQVRLGQVRLGWLGLVRLGWLGLVRFGQVWLGLVRLGQVRLGQVRLVRFGWVGQIWLDQVRLVRLGQVRHVVPFVKINHVQQQWVRAYELDVRSRFVKHGRGRNIRQSMDATITGV